MCVGGGGEMIFPGCLMGVRYYLQQVSGMLQGILYHLLNDKEQMCRTFCLPAVMEVVNSFSGSGMPISNTHRVKTRGHVFTAADGKFNYSLGSLFGIKTCDSRRGEC